MMIVMRSIIVVRRRRGDDGNVSVMIKIMIVSVCGVMRVRGIERGIEIEIIVVIEIEGVDVLYMN